MVSDVPEITEYPEDITADEGETVEFHCSVDDIDPHVRWGWKKEGGTIDQQRWVLYYGYHCLSMFVCFLFFFLFFFCKFR